MPKIFYDGDECSKFLRTIAETFIMGLGRLRTEVFPFDANFSMLGVVVDLKPVTNEALFETG